MEVFQVGHVADGKGRADGEFVAVELDHALRRLARELDDDLVGRVVQVGQAQIDLHYRAAHSAVARGSAERRVAPLGHAQARTNARRDQRGRVVFRRHLDGAGEIGDRATIGVGDLKRKRVVVARLRSARVGVGQGGEPRLHRSSITAKGGGAQGALGHAGGD